MLKWTPSFQYDTGTVTSFDLDDQGNCLEVHIGAGKQYYRVGKINNSDNSIDFGNSTYYARGNINCISLAKDGNFVEVHVSCNRLYSRVAQANFSNKTIEWRSGRQYDQYDSGYYCSIAIDKQDNCVEIHIGRSGLYYRLGKVNYTSKTIDWIRNGTIFSRGSYRNCSVALDELGNCLATYTDSSSRLAYSVGKLNDGKIDWSASSQYEQGNLTSVTLDSEGNCLETHIKCNRLYYCQGLLNSDNKTVNWGESIQYSENDRGKYTFTSVASDSQGNCFQTYVQAGRPNSLSYCSTQISSKIKTLWQIGKEKSRDEIGHNSGSWEKERNYTVGMDNEPIDNPNLPELISIANTPDDVLSAESVQIYFTLDQAYDPDILTLLYGYFGEEENRIFLDGQLLFKDFGISSTAIRHNRIPFPRIGAGEHILKIKVIGKRKGYHTISYLKLEALEEELEPTPTIGLYDVVMPISG